MHDYPKTKLSKYLADEIVRCEEELKAAKDNLSSAYSACHAEAPISVGDRIEVNGYSYQGETMVVKGFKVSKGFRGEFQWTVIGNIINKDGKPGSREGKSFYDVEIS